MHFVPIKPADGEQVYPQGVVQIDAMTGKAPSLRSTATATIDNAASVSGTVDLTGTALLGFVMPAAWTTAALNIEVSPDNATWSSPYDTTPAAVSSIATPVASAAYAVDMTAMLPWRYIRFRSGTTASPVNQGAARAIVCVTRPLA